MILFFIYDNSMPISSDIPKDHVVSSLDKSSLNLDESILNTKIPAVDRKGMTKSSNPGQILIRGKDQPKAFEGNLKQPQDIVNQKLKGGFFKY